jgi:hAT family C-terminal dimerisation region
MLYGLQRHRPRCPRILETKGSGVAQTLLTTVAHTMLAVPATSTSSERAFSLAGRILEERRTQLSPDTVDSSLFLHTGCAHDDKW